MTAPRYFDWAVRIDMMDIVHDGSRVLNDIASYAFVVDAKDNISHASHLLRRWSRTAADMLLAEPLRDLVLRLISDLDDH